jgi:hypothetical protein
MTHFKDYIEDYNTATMPHIKYYDLEKWEMDEYRKSTARNLSSAAQDDNDDYGHALSFNDEAAKQVEMKRLRAQAELDQFHAVKDRMASNKDQREDMRHQSVLRAELSQAYRQGDLEKVRKIEKKLKPDSNVEYVKHPWA